MKKTIINISIFVIIAIGILLLFNRGSSLSKNELSFLKQEGFVEKGKDLKSPNLIEQKIDSSDESFEVLATKLDLANHKYQLAFKLENKSNEEKEFFLIPVSESNQLEFQEIRGTVGKKEILIQNPEKEPLGKLYDIEKHKQELRPELAQAYQDIENNNYTAKPIKIILGPNSTLTANSQWQVTSGQTLDSLKSVYFLVYGSAGGVKDEFIILNVHSHPQAGDNWTVEFTTKGTADLIITPQDQATINDMDFVSLFCGEQKVTPQILANDVIFFPNWQCTEIGQITHLVNVAANHTLKFQFRDQIAYAYNSPGNPLIIEGRMLFEGGIGIKGPGPVKSSPSWTCGDTLTDTRDSKEYATVLIGSQCWMAENINVGTMTAGTNNQGTDCPSAAEIEKYCYNNTEGNCTLEGGLYQWAQTMCGTALSCNGTGPPPNDACAAPVQGICPDGWHIPSHYEWTTLELEVCDSGSCAASFLYDTVATGWKGTDEGRQLKNCRTVQSGGVPPAPCGVLTTDWPRWNYHATYYGTDTHGFSAHAAGYRFTNGSFNGRGSHTLIWSSLESGTSAWVRYVYSGAALVYRVSFSKLYGMSVRCLKD